ncbi:MAG: hypothetical protein WC553_01665 [Patescibacteria group bacterium]|jgi:hypothetical protein
MSSVNFIMNSLFILGEAVKRLVTLSGDNLETVLRCFQRIIDDPVYRHQVWLAMTGKLVVNEITPQEWLEREAQALIRLGLAEEDGGIPDEVRRALRGDSGINHYFIPGGLNRTHLIGLARKIGMKINSSPNCDGEELVTEAGTIECDLSAIMNSTDAEHRPFNLNADEHNTWAIEQGGDGLTSAEEALYLMIRHFMAFGRVLFMGGWIRCRNSYARGAADSLSVGFSTDGGLRVGYGDRSDRYWGYGAVARKFKPLVP